MRTRQAYTVAKNNTLSLLQVYRLRRLSPFAQLRLRIRTKGALTCLTVLRYAGNDFRIRTA